MKKGLFPMFSFSLAPRQRGEGTVLALAFSLVLATTTFAQAPAQRVADDALVIDRVAEVSKRDLPADLLKRIVNEDIDLLRGKRADGTYEFANYERLEAGRKTESC
jgi:hypothetical protein